MARPRLNVGSQPAPAADDTLSIEQDPAPSDSPTDQQPEEPIGGEVGERWIRPAAPASPSLPPAEVGTAPVSLGGVFRRSPSRKRNRTVSVPAETVTRTRTAARDVGLSLSDYTFVAVEELCERLRSNPQLGQQHLGRVVAPRATASTKAHMVLYLADDEWERWRDLAARGGLGTISALVSSALARR